MTEAPDPILVSIPNAAHAMGVGVTRFYSEVLNRGLVPTVRIGNRRLVPVAELHKLAERLTAEQMQQGSQARVSHSG